MQFTFTIFGAVTVLATFISASPAAQVKEPQLGLPSVVCLTGPLGDGLSGILSTVLPSISIVGCNAGAGQTCTPLDITIEDLIKELPVIANLLPIVGSLPAGASPIGTCEASA